MADIRELIRVLRRDEFWMGMRTTEYAEAGQRAEEHTVQLLARISEMEADVARLDWLDAQRTAPRPTVEIWGFAGPIGASLRSNIDAHMAISASLERSGKDNG